MMWGVCIRDGAGQSVVLEPVCVGVSVYAGGEQQ